MLCLDSVCLTRSFLASLVLAGCAAAAADPVKSPGGAGVRSVDVAEGWANNSINAVIFRKNSLVTDGAIQFVAFYDKDGFVVVGKRQLGAERWELKRTQYSGNVRDAHNSISIMVDGAGYLHLAWDHHNHGLRYARSVSPGSLELTPKMPMVGREENSVAYPEFYRLPDGDLLFLYRDGASGNGNMVVNRYSVLRTAWTRLQTKLISGEGLRNPYWQAFVDHTGTLHVSWVWREKPDVASNHDMAYARSRDGGLTWENSNGQAYALPITASSAEYAARVPPNSELINQTSMSADKNGNPYIASYWRDPGETVPQYKVLFRGADGWKRLSLDFRKAPFSLGGQGTKAIPISRPQIMVNILKDRPRALLVFRDQERGSKVSVVTIEDFGAERWSVRDLTQDSVGAWEPSFDTELWRREGQLNLFLQKVEQIDGEGNAAIGPSRIGVLQWTPGF
jgi:hypothetical protein